MPDGANQAAAGAPTTLPTVQLWVDSTEAVWPSPDMSALIYRGSVALTRYERIVGGGVGRLPRGHHPLVHPQRLLRDCKPHSSI